MILELHQRYIVTNPRLVFFGDKESDMEAAQSSGLCIDSILVDKDNFSIRVDEWIGTDDNF
jgi:histidinol phosphatase-like enzyme